MAEPVALVPSAGPPGGASGQRLYDAHNHLHDARLAPWRDAVVTSLEGLGVARMVVNGSCEADWPAVRALARSCSRVMPAFGYHPWYVRERTPAWQAALVRELDDGPAVVGEIGLDRWIKDADLAAQEEVFLWQWRLAVARGLPPSVHCLQAWGWLHRLLRQEARPACGFLLHSYGGPVELVKPLAALGAYFSFPGYFMEDRKIRQRAAFGAVPPDRLLIETDAPDQCLPEGRTRFPLTEAATGRRLNHPANLGAIYEFVAALRGEPVAVLAEQVEANFLRLFGGVR